MTTCVFLLISCTKKMPYITPEKLKLPPTPEILSMDNDFLELNECLDRFDPKYLQVVYNDKRTNEEINTEASKKINQLFKSPDNHQYQIALSDFYKFSSFQELIKFSNTIILSKTALISKYFNNKTLIFDSTVKNYYLARRLYAKHKLQLIKNYTDRKSSFGVGQDYVEANLSSFNYYELVSNESIDEVEASGESGFRCSDKCCFEYFNCKNSAKNVYLEKLIYYVFPPAFVMARMGFISSTGFPGIGNVAGTIGGFVLGGISGALVANNYYQREINGCVIKYNECAFLRDQNK